MFLSGNIWNAIYNRMQSDFEAVIDWTLCNNLRLNQKKNHAIIFGSKLRLSNNIEPTPFRMSGKNVNFINSQSYLGIILDDNMSLMPLVKSVKKKDS